MRPGAAWSLTTVNGAQALYEIYLEGEEPTITGRVTVPVLWDKQTRTIVNNESADIIRMFNSAFDGIGAKPGDYYPKTCGQGSTRSTRGSMRTSTTASIAAASPRRRPPMTKRSSALFATLDDLEARLASSRFLFGDRLTEADWRLFVTLLRFDPVYVGLFKCNIRRIEDYPNLRRYRNELRAWPGVEETVDLFHIKHHYYESLRFINPTGIVPAGPV